MNTKIEPINKKCKKVEHIIVQSVKMELQNIINGETNMLYANFTEKLDIYKKRAQKSMLSSQKRKTTDSIIMKKSE